MRIILKEDDNTVKKFLLLTLSIVLIAGLSLISCAKEEAPAPAAPAPAPAAPAPATPAKPTAPTPISGGTLRVISGFGIPTNIGDPRQPGTFPAWNDWREGLGIWDKEGKGIYTPWLAESWDLDANAKTMTFHIRKGVKFHDGTTLNAQAVKWNLEQQSVNLPDIQDVKSMDVIDDYTLKLTFNKYSALNLITITFAVPIFSPTAIQNSPKDYYLTHEAGTGPFKVVDVKAGSYVKLTKFDDYWGDKPYLDGIDIIAITDPTVATLTMLKGDADLWYFLPLKEAVDLINKGLKTNEYLGGLSWLSWDSANDGSVYASQKVREAIEYALDRPAMAKTVGLGHWLPLTQLAGPETVAYVPGLNPRPFNPDKARQLLTEAGYPNGFKTTLIIQNNSENIMIASLIQSYLKDVKIDAEINQVDSAAYFGMLAPGGTGWKNAMLLAGAGHDPGVGFVRLDLGNYFSTKPNSWQPVLAHSAAWAALYDQVAICPSFEAAADLGKKMVQQLADDAAIAPLWETAAIAVYQPWVHTSQFLAKAPAWNPELDWIEKH
jgi:peptide/nickel transport system substrate-binding protein